MILGDKFYNEFNKLQEYKENENWSKFFELVFKIERLGEKRENALYSVISRTKTVDKNIVQSFEKLDFEKDKYAKLTDTKNQYEAVFNCVSSIKERFSTIIHE